MFASRAQNESVIVRALTMATEVGGFDLSMT